MTVIMTQIELLRYCLNAKMTRSVLVSNLWAYKCLQCFDTVGWGAGRASGL